jgi:hypothetical protein
MNRQLALALFALFASAASASTTVPRVDAVADPLAPPSVTASCSSPRFRAPDIEAVLGSHDSAATPFLRGGLIRAVKKACEQQVARIVVSRRGRHVSWSPALDTDGAVAIALK